MLVGRSVRCARNAARRLTTGRSLGPPSTVHFGAWRQQRRQLVATGDDSTDQDADVEVPRKSSPSRNFTADEMEFFDELNFEEFVDDDNDGEENEFHEEQERRKQILDELDQRKGRGWSDPWEITDEDWMQRRTLDDLPDWAPTLCSRISMERVKVYPGKECDFVFYISLPYFCFVCPWLILIASVLFPFYRRGHSYFIGTCQASIASSATSSPSTGRCQGLWQDA